MNFLILSYTGSYTVPVNKYGFLFKKRKDFSKKNFFNMSEMTEYVRKVSEFS